jgi:predicted kinase
MLRAAQADVVDHPSPTSEAVEDYLRLASRYAEELGPKLLLIVGGMSGTGKSTIAKRLAEVLCGELLQTDTVREELTAGDGKNDFPNGKYTTNGRNRVYEAMLQRIPERFGSAGTVILDGTFAARSHRRAAVACAQQLGATVLQIQCQCPPDVARQRIADRLQLGGSPSEATTEVYSSQVAAAQPPLASSDQCCIDTTNPLSEQVELVLSRIRPLLT